MNDRPYTCDSLAQRWDVSAETVRQMIKRGDINAFMVGKLYRIPATEVERHESCKNSQLVASIAASASTGMRAAKDDAIVLRHAPERKRKPRPATLSLVN